MNKCKQLLSTCSPLERVVQFNNAVTHGVTNLQLRLKNQKADKYKKADICKKPACKLGPYKGTELCYNKQDPQPASTSTASPRGCMPFSDGVPIRSPPPPVTPSEMRQCSKNKTKVKLKDPCNPHASTKKDD